MVCEQATNEERARAVSLLRLPMVLYGPSIRLCCKNDEEISGNQSMPPPPGTTPKPIFHCRDRHDSSQQKHANERSAFGLIPIGTSCCLIILRVYEAGPGSLQKELIGS